MIEGREDDEKETRRMVLTTLKQLDKNIRVSLDPLALFARYVDNCSITFDADL